MIETRYSARSPLASPRQFLAEALADLRRSAAMVWPLFLRNVRTRHRGSLLGYLWLFAPALATTAVCLHLQQKGVITASDARLPYAVQVLTGIVLWQLFVESLNAPLQHLRTARGLITRSRLPHEAIILAGALEALLNVGARLLVVAAVMALFGVAPGAGLVLAPLGVCGLILTGLAVGLFLAPWGLLYEDVGKAIPPAVALWFFLTPVIYPSSQSGLLGLNPVSPLLEATRAWLTGGRASGGVILEVAAVAAALVVAWLFYRVARPHVIARLG